MVNGSYLHYSTLCFVAYIPEAIFRVNLFRELRPSIVYHWKEKLLVFTSKARSYSVMFLWQSLKCHENII